MGFVSLNLYYAPISDFASAQSGLRVLIIPGSPIGMIAA